MPTKKERATTTRTLFVRIPREQHRRLKLLAVDRETRVAVLVRAALARYLQKEAPNGQA